MGTQPPETSRKEQIDALLLKLPGVSARKIHGLDAYFVSDKMFACISGRGIGLRLPTICVRPGKPNLAASGFFSGIIREPLAGQEALLPVPETVRHWFASPRAAIGFLIHSSRIKTEELGARRNLTMPGISATVGEQIEALRRVAGEKAAKLIRRQPDQVILRIVEGWPRNFDTKRALSLGFRADASFEEIIRIHLEDELRRNPAPRTGSA